MCGIFGLVSNKPMDLQAFASKMAAALAHRGPDAEGAWENQQSQVMLGNRRLSIIDVAQGHQPMHSDDGQIVVVQNGEIYNYLELQAELKTRGVCFRTDSDTEVILRLYETEGIEFVGRLNGMFAIAIWDARVGKMLLFRDRLGIKPLFIGQTEWGMAFASEMKALLAIGVMPVMRREAVHHYLSFNYVPPTMTMFEHIEHLPAGHALRICHGQTHQWQWWQPDFTIQHQPENAWAEELRYTLQQAVRIHLRSDVEVGAFLSGGVDSSSVVALAAREVNLPLHSFSIGFDDARFDESVYAQIVATQYGTQHHLQKVQTDLTASWPLCIYHTEQPHGDASFMPTLALSALAASCVKVVLTGDGGDELFAGYERYLPLVNQFGSGTISNEVFGRAYFANQGLLTHAEKLALYTPQWQREFASHESAELIYQDVVDSKALDPINRILWMDLKWLLPANNLVKPDRMGMAVGLEARLPFLDNRMIDLALRMPGEMKLHGGVTKYILKEAMKNDLSAEILHRPKQMFTVPIGEWFKTHLSQYVRDMLLSKRAVERGIFSAHAIAGLIDSHINGQQNHTRILRALIALEIWQRLFVDGELPLPEPV